MKLLIINKIFKVILYILRHSCKNSETQNLETQNLEPQDSEQ